MPRHRVEPLVLNCDKHGEYECFSHLDPCPYCYDEQMAGTGPEGW